MLGLYLHIPFCSAICPYCNFNRGLLDEALKTRYLAALERDIARLADGAAADTVYFGGGTPSLLQPAEVTRLLAACRSAFALSPDAEITLEMNPEHATADTLAGYRAAGVNRLSLGVQSFRDDELRRLGRLHSAERAREAVRLARAAGFDNVSLDLMLWLPQQTPADSQQSVETLCEIGPEHASLYLLELYPNAPLRDEMARAGWSRAPDEDAADMYLRAFGRLEAAGYEQYEISNVARPGRRSRHNLKYWSDGDWLGFGCGAHSTRGGVRWKNLASTAEYVDRLEAGGDPCAEQRPLAAPERLAEALFMGLRLVEGVDLVGLGRRYGVDAGARYGPALAEFARAGLVEVAPPRVRLTRHGMLLSNEVLQVFV